MRFTSLLTVLFQAAYMNYYILKMHNVGRPNVYFENTKPEDKYMVLGMLNYLTISLLYSKLDSYIQKNNQIFSFPKERNSKIMLYKLS